MDQAVIAEKVKDGDARTVQDYIDETPYWADGTSVPDGPMSDMQWRIWWLSIAGKFFEGLVVFMTGVALPLLSKDWDLTAAQQGMVGAATLFGILVGASALGALSDYFGRKPMFIFEIGLFALFLALIVVSPGFIWFIVCLFGLGLALGCDYPTAHVMISESTPSRIRGRLVLGAFGFQAAGALAGTAVGYFALSLDPDVGAWRWMYGAALIPALLVLIGRYYVTESPHWLAEMGQDQKAEHELNRLLQRHPPYPPGSTFRPQRPRRPPRRSPATRRCSRRKTGVHSCWHRCLGSFRISAPTASASSRRPFSPPPWGTSANMHRTSPIWCTTIFSPPRARP